MKILNKVKKYKFVFIIILLAIAFFSATLTITFDSAHYLSYVDIFEGRDLFSNWDIVRGPVFPLLLFFGDLLFGKSAIGLLSILFLIYLVYFYIICKISDVLFNKVKYRNIFKIIFVLYCTFNPLVFGYFHTLLTEFLAITLMTLSCFLSWKWIYVKNRKEKILYSLFYILFLTFAYFLKQPYICVIFIPLVISSIISIIKKHSLRNIVYRIGTFIISFVVLFVFIIVWNSILINHGVDMNTGRDSSSMLSGQLMAAISNVKVSKVKSYNQIKNNKSLTKKELRYAKKELKRKNKLNIVKIYKNKKLIESDLLLADKKYHSSVITVFKEVLFLSIKHPVIIFNSYSNSYCALSSICVIKSNDGVGYWITKDRDYTNLFENEIIAYKTFRNESNLFYLTESKYESAKYYEQQTSLSITSKMIYSMRSLTNFLYKISIMLLPLFSLLMLIFLFFKRKSVVKLDIFYFSIIFLLSSFLTGVSCTIVGQIIDRYLVYCFITALIGIISGMIFIINNININKIGGKKLCKR